MLKRRASEVKILILDLNFAITAGSDALRGFNGMVRAAGE
jgi:hypothetical protein